MRQLEHDEKTYSEYGFTMLFSESFKIMVNTVTFVGFRGAVAPIASLDPPLLVTRVMLYAAHI